MGIFSNQVINSDIVMTMGTFDGVHIGHQQIIELTVNRAQELGCKSMLFTFTDHPLQVVSPENYPSLLTSWEQKERIIKQLGIDYIWQQEFTSEFADLTYHQFIKELLTSISLEELIVGADFRCGHQGKGTPSKLSYLGRKYGFTVKAIPAVQVAGEEVSSTAIRRLIKEGQVDKVADQLGRNFVLHCQVVSGDKRGRELGFPTANLEPVVDYVLPPAGVYACRVTWQGTTYAGVVNLGLRPTFTNDRFSIEVHILDFNYNLYQEEVELEFVKKIREEREFVRRSDLIAQIEQDIKQAKNILEE